MHVHYLLNTMPTLYLATHTHAHTLSQRDTFNVGSCS